MELHGCGHLCLLGSLQSSLWLPCSCQQTGLPSGRQCLGSTVPGWTSFSSTGLPICPSVQGFYQPSPQWAPCDAAGVLDLVDDRVTHLFCPSSQGEVPTSSLHRQPSQSCAWTIDGQYFCTSGCPVRILDFRPSPQAACAVPTGEMFVKVSAALQSSNRSVHHVCCWPADDMAGSPQDGAAGRVSFAIAVPESVSALDVCCTTDSIIAGTVHGGMLLLSQQRES